MRRLRIVWNSPEYKSGAPIMTFGPPMLDGEQPGDTLKRVYESVEELDALVNARAIERGISVTRSCAVVDDTDPTGG